MTYTEETVDITSSPSFSYPGETEFQKWVFSLFAKDNLPFDIDLNILPDTEGCTFADIGKLKIPVFNELLQREELFFQKMRNMEQVKSLEMSKKGRELRDKMTPIAKEIADKAGLKYKNDAEALDLVFFNRGESWDENEAFVEALTEKSDDIAEINLQMIQLTEGSRFSQWASVTFFIASRVDPKFTPEAISVLRQSQVKQIQDLIATESNKGVPPVIESDESESETSEAPKLKEAVDTSAKSATSSGKSKD